MSDDNNKRFKINMSFEDAMKKAATTKMNPAMQIDAKDKETEIPNLSGKSIEFIELYIEDQDVVDYCLMYSIAPIGGEDKWYQLPFNFTPNADVTPKKKYSIHYIGFENIKGRNPTFIPSNHLLNVKVVSVPHKVSNEF